MGDRHGRLVVHRVQLCYLSELIHHGNNIHLLILITSRAFGQTPSIRSKQINVHVVERTVFYGPLQCGVLG